MIFISHNSKDKEFVGSIAYELRTLYGEENVFYDEWSIKPGENILTTMSDGIEKTTYFFYFITRNSLKSDMVNLEWTAALLKHFNDNIEFIPVRADNVNPPAIISALNYLDLYNDGLELTILQMHEIISGVKIERNSPTFNNIVAYMYQENNKEIHFYVTARRFIEHHNGFLIKSDAAEDELEVVPLEDGMVRKSFLPKIEGENNGFIIDFNTPINPGFYSKLAVILSVEKQISIDIYLIRTENRAESLEIKIIDSLSDLPKL